MFKSIHMNMRSSLVLGLGFVAFTGQVNAQDPSSILKMDPVSFAQVAITDSFWKPKIDKVAVKTLAACIYQTEVATPRIRNFEKVARGKGEAHEGIFYDDSDVFKALEAMAYSLKTHPSAEMEAKCDEWIDKIAAAQQPDGYLNTYYTLRGIQDRYTDMSMHEDYNAGHMIEAGVAYYNATGKRKLLDVCIKWADHFDSLFGPGKKHWVTGHQELELALVKLYRVTNNSKYLNLSNWLLAERGHGYAKGYTWTDWKDTGYAQDLLPVKDQTQITGHAVRAMYMYTGAADVAALTGDQAYMKAMKAVWEDVVYRNMYITGGIGSAGSNEGFSQDYDLPNEQAYCETCASVGMVFWNQRMNLLTGESKYIDVLERSLYNGALDGLSLTGDRFFYGNPLASRGQHQRREWFGTACCPANIARLVASLGDYIYARNNEGLWVNLFVSNRTNFVFNKQPVSVTLNTNYPSSGAIELNVDPVKKAKFTLHLRIPGWLNGELTPGGTYVASEPSSVKPELLINGVTTPYIVENGYVVLNREWKKGDKISYRFPMNTVFVKAKEAIKQDEGRVAIQRGPLVYCVEGADNNNAAWNIILPEKTSFVESTQSILDESVISLKANVPVVTISSNGTSIQTETKTITAIPYYTWANRGKNEMQIWLPTTIKNIKINYVP